MTIEPRDDEPAACSVIRHRNARPGVVRVFMFVQWRELFMQFAYPEEEDREDRIHLIEKSRIWLSNAPGGQRLFCGTPVEVNPHSTQAHVHIHTCAHLCAGRRHSHAAQLHHGGFPSGEGCVRELGSACAGHAMH